MAPSSDALSDLKDAFDPKAIATGLYRESHFMTPCIREMEIISAARPSSTSASIVYRLPVTQDILNPTGSMHGGAIATLYDVCTTWLLFLVEGWKPVLGTTRSLNCVYLRPAREGDFVRVECETVSVGRRLALLRGRMIRESDGKLVSTAEHDKYNVNADDAKM